MKKRVKTPATPFDRTLLAPGREEEAAAAIAERYRMSMEMTSGRPTPLSDWHAHLAMGILQRNARAFEFISNGLNDVAKKVFVEVTGITLPRQQGRTWEILRDWGGITAAEDALYRAERSEQAYRRHLQRYTDPEDVQAMIMRRVMDEGYDRIIVIGREHHLANTELGRSINLSQPGSGWANCRDYLDTVIELKKARAAVEAERQPVTRDPALVALDQAMTAAGRTRQALALCHADGPTMITHVDQHFVRGCNRLVAERGQHRLVNEHGAGLDLSGRTKLNINARHYAQAMIDLARQREANPEVTAQHDRERLAAENAQETAAVPAQTPSRMDGGAEMSAAENQPATQRALSESAPADTRQEEADASIDVADEFAFSMDY